MRVEKLKSVTLGILFVICLGLTSQLLYDFNGFGDTSSQNLKSEKMDLESILNPQSCQVSFGGGLYSGLFSSELQSSLWQETKNYLKNYIQYIDVETIDEKVWNSAVKEKSVLFVMPFEMTLSQVSDMLLPNFKLTGSDIPFNQIIIPANDDRNFYIASERDRKYYKLRGIVRGDFIRNIIDKVDSDTGTVKAMRIEDLFTLKSVLEVQGQPFKENNVLLPNTTLKELPYIKIKDEVSPSTISEGQLKNFINKAFGERNDFVKKVEDIEGSVVYIYGYGEKALKIGVDGSVQFKSKPDAKGVAKAGNFQEGLTLALKAIDLYGSRPEALYLSNYKEEKNGQGEAVRRYSFNYLIQNLPVYFNKVEAADPIEVEVTDGQVSLVNRDIKQFINTFSLEFWNETKDVFTILQDNNDIISAQFAKYDFKGKPTENMNKFSYEQLQSIKSLNLCYFYDRNVSKDNLVPSWRLQEGSTIYYLNAYNGQIMHMDHLERKGAN